MTIAVTGATGQLGRLVIARLVAAGQAGNTIALVRTPAKASDLGVAVREADYSQPETLGPALFEVKTLVLISSSEIGQRIAQHQNAIDAAKAAGVTWIIYTSLLRADTSPIDLAPEHAATEAALKASGVPYTILRHGWYTENYTGSIGGVLAGGAVYGSAGAGRIASASRADFADGIVTVLRTGGHAGQTYELAGDTAWTLADYAAEIAKQTGRPIPYTDIPAAAYAEALTGFGVPAGFASMIAGWDVAASNGALFDESRKLSALIGRPTTPLAVTVAEALAQTAGAAV